MHDKKKIPKSAISRLSLYLREITRLEKDRRDKISSTELGDYTGLTDAQVRKDLSYFGQFGTSGAGYDIPQLKKAIQRILGKDRKWHIVLIGVGNIGSALLRYPGFKDQGFIIKQAFDISPEKIGKRYGDVTIKDIENIDDIVKDKSIKIAIIAVPPASAQDVGNILVKSGIKCILNFAPVLLRVNNDVIVKNIDLSQELENFSFFLASQED